MFAFPLLLLQLLPLSPSLPSSFYLSSHVYSNAPRYFPLCFKTVLSAYHLETHTLVTGTRINCLFYHKEQIFYVVLTLKGNHNTGNSLRSLFFQLNRMLMKITLEGNMLKTKTNWQSSDYCFLCSPHLLSRVIRLRGLWLINVYVIQLKTKQCKNKAFVFTLFMGDGD